MIRLILFFLMVMLTAASAAAQCATVYVDGAVSADKTTVYAWSVLTDNYTNPYGDCGMFYGGYTFTHTYEGGVTITSPTGRAAYGYSANSQSSGGTGYDRADASIAVGDDYGVFNLQGSEKITCSVAGPFYDASVPGESQNVPQPAYIVNFRQVLVSRDPNGALYFHYGWSSSTGVQADLAECRVGESVFYPGSSSQYEWPLPMVARTVNPTVRQGSGANSGFLDQNLPPDGYRLPYSTASFTATQRLWWTCPGWDNGQMQYPFGDVDVKRKVFQDGSVWKYQITKSDQVNTAQLP
jgi:hypothetical protein